MSLARRATEHYGGKWHGSYGSAPAPGHSKADQGLTFRDAPDAPDGLLVNSFNGADPLAVKDDLRRAGILPPLQKSGEGWRTVATFEYADAQGEVLYRTRRLEKTGAKKRFLAERMEAGAWVAGLGQCRRVPYRLPELRQAIDKGETIYFAEGERKADRLAEMGFAATAIAFGCKGWRGEYSAHFAGAKVCILPDNDEPGRTFAAQVARSIAQAGGETRILELPGLPDAGDILDWPGNAEELRALTAAAPSDLKEPGAGDTLPLADLAAWAETQPSPKAFIWQGRIPAGEVTILTGKGGANKSTAGQQLAICRAASLPFLGVDLAPGKTLYLTAEDSEARLHWMHDHICRAVGADPARLTGNLFVTSLRGETNCELATFDAEGRIRPSPTFARLKATLAATGADMVILDNVAHLFVGNENDRGQVTAFVNLLYSLGATVLLIGHPNKAGDSYSGSTAWLNAVRSQLVVEFADELDPEARAMTVGKANYARPGDELRYRWHDFALRLESELPADTRAELDSAIRASGGNAAFLRCLAACNEKRRAVSHHPGANFYGKIFPAMPEAKGFDRRAFEAAFERLLHLGEIELDAELWQGSNRHWKTGIRAVDKCANPPAPTPCADLRQPHPQVTENTCAELRAPTPPYTTYKEGAALEAAAPLQSETTCLRCGDAGCKWCEQ